MYHLYILLTWTQNIQNYIYTQNILDGNQFGLFWYLILYFGFFASNVSNMYMLLLFFYVYIVLNCNQLFNVCIQNNSKNIFNYYIKKFFYTCIFINIWNYISVLINMYWNE